VKISVVIPAFNEEKLLPVTLASLQNSLPVLHERGWETELIVCDNNSTDRTGDIARTAGVKVVFEPMNQIARARNTGVSIATGDWLLILDADSKPSRELLDDTAEAIASGRCILGGTTLQPDEVYFTSWVVYKVWNFMSRWRRWATGPFIFCERSVFLELKGFDEILYSSEDIDFALRMRRLARQTGKSILILHRHPLVTSARKFKLYRWRDYLWFLAKTLFTRGRTLRDKQDCYTWYDGRR
jgi:glycosyltransferase involved in cell wall biosynthesis